MHMQCTIQFENLYGANLLNEKMVAGKAGFAILLNKTQNKNCAYFFVYYNPDKNCD